MIDSFEEINDFVGEHGNEPSMNGSVIEQKLAYRLSGIRQNVEKSAGLAEYDCFGLLVDAPKKYDTLDDVLADEDDVRLLDVASPQNSIFTLTHVKAVTLPDYISKRKPCRDFEKYEPLFKKCQAELAQGERQILPFKKGLQINECSFFVLSGVLLYVEKIGDLTLDAHGDANGRTHCIFENGTESDMRFRSLSSGLYKDGRRITELNERLLDCMKDIQKDDQETGYIYILKSLSPDSRIQSIEYLYKIGYSVESVEERIKNAEREPTYLMAPVEIVDSFRCFNLNPQKLEQLLHNFFGESCLNIDIFDEKGQRHLPREWFIAPYSVIYQAIYFILNGEIVDYRYDPIKEEIVSK